MKKQSEDQIGKLVIVPIINPDTGGVTFKILGQVKGINHERGVLEIGDVSSICGYGPVKPIRYRSDQTKPINPN